MYNTYYYCELGGIPSVDLETLKNLKYLSAHSVSAMRVQVYNINARRDFNFKVRNVHKPQIGIFIYLYIHMYICGIVIIFMDFIRCIILSLI